MSNQAQKYDFNQPQSLPNESTDQLTVWMKALCSQLKEVWSQVSTTLYEFQTSKPIVQTFSEARGQIAPATVAFQTSFSTSNTPSMILMERPVLLNYVLEILGDPSEELAEDRELSDLQWSIARYWFEIIAEKLSLSWPQQDPLPFKLLDAESQPHRSRLLAPDVQVLVYSISCKAPFGDHVITWIAPQEPVENLLGKLDGTSVSIEKDSSDRIEQLAKQLPVDAQVELGSTSISIGDLASLKVGDIVVLDKKISETIDLQINGGIQLKAWPKRRDTKQVLEVHSMQQT